jgi:hypothetical protein
MLYSKNLSRWMSVAFMLLVAFALVYAIKSRSTMGVILSLTSLVAGIHFLNLLSKARRELQQEEETA